MADRTGKEETRRRLLSAAGRVFRARGFGAGGIDALAKDAGVTSGAVYEHFGSKAELLEDALVDGLEQFRDGLAEFKAERKGSWLAPFARWYVSRDRRAKLEESCTLATLTLDAARAGKKTRAAYARAFRELVEEVERGLPGPHAERRAIAILATLAGGLMIGHATHDSKFGERIAPAIVEAVSAIASAGIGR